MLNVNTQEVQPTTVDGPIIKIDLVKRQIKVFTIGLQCMGKLSYDHGGSTR